MADIVVVSLLSRVYLFIETAAGFIDLSNWQLSLSAHYMNVQKI
jgi:hypothetical protein